MKITNESVWGVILLSIETEPVFYGYVWYESHEELWAEEARTCKLHLQEKQEWDDEEWPGDDKHHSAHTLQSGCEYSIMAHGSQKSHQGLAAVQEGVYRS